jgi:predicted transcriptional regulator
MSSFATPSWRNRSRSYSRQYDYKQVHRNLSELEDIGVIEFEGGGSGQAKKPVLAYDGLEIDIPFTQSDDSVGTAAP